MIEVLHPGALTTIQDLGRTGYEQYGIPRSGPLDPFLARIANRLVGNPRDAAVIEFALTGPSLRFVRECCIAITGPTLGCSVNGKPISLFCGFRISAGEILDFQTMNGWFGYLAIGGGLQAEKILGSKSTYLAGKIGNRLQKGETLHFGDSSGKCYAVKDTEAIISATNIVLILPGLHAENFSEADRQILVSREYRISAQSNRMGIRLDGPQIGYLRIRRSVPTLAGTIQINRSGQPMILGPEGPTTGGYPQIANLCAVAWTTLALSGPSHLIRFQWTTRREARRMLQAREEWMESTKAFELL